MTAGFGPGFGADFASIFKVSDGTMGRMEIITGRERRRQWSDEDKLRILEEASDPRLSAAAIYAREGVEIARSTMAD